MIDEFKDQEEIQLIVFLIGEEEYAVPIVNVQEIIMVQDPTHIPKAPAWVEGLINLRGRIIPVIDGKKKFLMGCSEKTQDSRIMILDIDNEITGLIVDEVNEVVHLKTENIEPTPVDLDEDHDFFWGVGKLGERLLILINPARFLSESDSKMLRKSIDIAEPIPKVA